MVHINTYCHPPTHASTWISLQALELRFWCWRTGFSMWSYGLLLSGSHRVVLYGHRLNLRRCHLLPRLQTFQHRNSACRKIGQKFQRKQHKEIHSGWWLATLRVLPVPVYKLKQDLTQTQMTHLGRDMSQHWALYSHSKNFTKVAESLLNSSYRWLDPHVLPRKRYVATLDYTTETWDTWNNCRLSCHLLLQCPWSTSADA